MVVVVESSVVVVVLDAEVANKLFGPYTESLHEAPQISSGFPEQGLSHSSGATGIILVASFPQ